MRRGVPFGLRGGIARVGTCAVRLRRAASPGRRACETLAESSAAAAAEMGCVGLSLGDWGEGALAGDAVRAYDVGLDASVLSAPNVMEGVIIYNRNVRHNRDLRATVDCRMGNDCRTRKPPPSVRTPSPPSIAVASRTCGHTEERAFVRVPPDSISTATLRVFTLPLRQDCSASSGSGAPADMCSEMHRNSSAARAGSVPPPVQT